LVRVSALTGLVALLAAAACQPNTSRPPFAPLLEAAGTEVRLPVKDATKYLADALRNDSIPIGRVVPRDGYLESPWFDSKSKRPVKGHRPLGLDVVRVRAWADPSRPGSSQLSVETSYRVLADPSLPERELDRQVPLNHPIGIKVEEVLKQLVQRYGGPPPPAPAAQSAPAEPDADENQ
jgi:hypothetical protein